MNTKLFNGAPVAPTRFFTCSLGQEVFAMDIRTVRRIEPPPSFGATVRCDFIQGMGKVQNRFDVILEPDRASTSSRWLRAASLHRSH